MVRFSQGQMLLITVGGFFVFFFALALGATLSDSLRSEKIVSVCAEQGGRWNDAGFCEKSLNVCEPNS